MIRVGRRARALGRAAASTSLLAAALLALGPLACREATTEPDPGGDPSASAPAPIEPTPAPPPASSGERSLFFGDLHVHSSWSFDAWFSGVRARPRDAYRFARGEAIDHVSGEPIQLEGPPLDFIALTDHAEYLGVVQAARTPDHPLAQTALIRNWLSGPPAAQRAAHQRIHQTYGAQQAIPALVHDSVLRPAWNALVNLANAQNDPGAFTAFVAFEYTAAAEGRNLHRNVLFRGATAPARPFSAMDSGNPEALWRWMDDARADGHDALSIPHNPNGSDGWMFADHTYDTAPIDADWVALRARNEPAAEIMQIKGQSETHPALSPDDAWAGFEIVDVRTMRPQHPSEPKGSYWRDALRRGLAIGDTVGANPYRLGAVASTDGHNAASPVEESRYFGKLGTKDATPTQRLERVRMAPGLEPTVTLATRWGGAAGLAGVWAEENTRASLFDALRRRETFATSGPRIRLRMFGGWDFTEAEARGDHARVGDARGVAMGGVLAPNGRDRAPVLLVRAQQDPREAALERLQIVKGWMRDGETFERIYDVACWGGATPDAETARCPEAAAVPALPSCEPAPGAAELSAHWRDPDYAPGTSVFYYARALQVPSCRWSTRDAIRLGREPVEGVDRFIQERAIGSPIWVDARPATPAPR